MMNLENCKPDPEQRRAQLLELMMSGPNAERMIPEADRPILVDLLIHTLDDTVDHMMALIERAKPSLTDPMLAEAVMMPLAFMLIGRQMSLFAENLRDQALAQMLDRMAPEDVAAILAEALGLDAEDVKVLNLRDPDALEAVFGKETQH